MSISEENQVDCGDMLDITVVQDLHPQLKEALLAGGKVVLDVSAVERADAAALQLLCAFIHEAAATGVEVQWHKPTAGLYDAVSLLGLEAELGLTEH